MSATYDSTTVLSAVTELAARWHRAEKQTLTDQFTRGRMTAYEQAIALLLDVNGADVRTALVGGKL